MKKKTEDMPDRRAAEPPDPDRPAAAPEAAARKARQKNTVETAHVAARTGLVGAPRTSHLALLPLVLALARDAARRDHAAEGR